MENQANQAPNPYDAVLADLLRKKDELDRLIALILPSTSGNVKIDLPASPDSRQKQQSNNGNVEIRGDAFFGLSIPDAIRKLLSLKCKPLTPAEIAQSLEDGGVTHQSTSFVNTVGSVLHRLSKGNDSGVVLVKRGQYGLIEWYPGYRRKNSAKNVIEKEENKDDASDLA